jgi:multidrug efflux pump subunit AcrA (membrane-fusion protein)
MALTRWGIGVGAVLLALIIAAVLVQTAPKPEPGEGLAVASRVPVIELRQVALGRQWRGLGTARAVAKAAVPAQVAAVVKTVPQDIEEGVRVEAGQVLATLESEDFEQQAAINRANIASLEAQLNQLDVQEKRLAERADLERELVEIAAAERDRVERIYESGAAGRQGYDLARRLAIEAERALTTTLEQLDAIGPRRNQLQAQRLSQQASLELAELNVRRCTIRSPISGIIQTLNVEPGERIAPGQPVAQVVGLERIEVPLNVPASARTDLTTGDPVLIRSASREDRTWDATVTRILPQDDPSSRTATFFATVEQPDAEARFGTPAGATLLLPGAFVSGMVTSDNPTPRWVVPRRSVRNDRVLRVRDGVIQSCEVEAAFSFEGRLPRFGIPDDQWVVLRDDAVPFAPGDQIVVNVAVTLKDGSRIEPLVLSDEATTDPASRAARHDHAAEDQP